MLAEDKNPVIVRLRVYLVIALFAMYTYMQSAIAESQKGSHWDDLCSLSSDFKQMSDVASWKLFQIPGWAAKWDPLTVQDNNLVIKPRSSAWYEDMYGGFLYKEVSGNFIATTRVRALGRTSNVPQRQFSLGGLLIRAPRKFTKDTWQPGQENWLFVSTGCADVAGTPQFETKTTTNSHSALKVYPARADWIDLRVARIGHTFYFFQRYKGGSWTLLDKTECPDFPAIAEVGLTAYSDWTSLEKVYPNCANYNVNGVRNGQPDLALLVSFVHFRRPTKAGNSTLQGQLWQELISD